MPGMPQPGAEWAGFHIESRIGVGGSGQVFAAWDPGLERRVAIKVLDPDADDVAKQRFLRESKLAGGLDHPRIVPIHRADTFEDSPFIVMRFVAGGDLRAEIAAGPLTLERATSVIGQVAGALDRAHRAGLVHRDVKPANILCADDGDDVYLTDFGITRAMEQAPADGLTVTGQTMASPHYASPEQLRGEALAAPTDVYGLGCTLFESLTGRVPFPGETAHQVAGDHLHRPPPFVTELRPDLDPSVDDVVATAMAKDPAERFRTTRHLAEALALVPSGARGTPGEPPTPATRPESTIHDTTVPAVIAGAEHADGPDDAADLDDPDATQAVAASPADEPVAGSRSVFDDPAASLPWADTVSHDIPDDHTDTLPVIPDPGPVPGGPSGREVDGAAFGVYEDEDRRSRVAAVVIGLLAIAALAVGGLVWRAVNTDAELSAPGTTSSTTTASTVPPATVEALRAFVPAGIDTCVEPADGDGTPDGAARLECPIDGVPELLTLTMYPSDAELDDAFRSRAAALEVPDRADAECALGRTGLHDYESPAGGGSVACTAGGGSVTLLWARSDAAVLGEASGGGQLGSYVQAWAGFVERTDATFPVPEEQQLLDVLPDSLLGDCRRDLGLVLASGGRVGVACEPADAEPAVVSWVRFTDGGTMDGWFDAQRTRLADDNVFDATDDGCTPKGYGDPPKPQEVEPDPDEGDGDDEEDEDEPPKPPAPTAAVMSYAFGGSSGQILCFVNASDQNVLIWARDGSRIGSIAVTDAADGAKMKDLLEWFEDGGYRP